MGGRGDVMGTDVHQMSGEMEGRLERGMLGSQNKEGGEGREETGYQKADRLGLMQLTEGETQGERSGE